MTENVSENFIISDLNRKLEEANAKIASLEQECDDLAFENNYLREKLENLANNASNTNPEEIKDNVNSSTKPLESKATNIENAFDWTEMLEEGSGRYIQKPSKQIINACSGSNIVCASIIHINDHDIAICGGADKTLRGYELLLFQNSETNSADASGYSVVFNFDVAAPPLFIDVINNFFASSLMDGSLIIGRVTESGAEVVKKIKDQNKYGVCVKWSPDGALLAVASYDKSVVLYRKLGSLGGGIDFEQVRIFRYHVTPEALVFAPSTSSTSVCRDDSDISALVKEENSDDTGGNSSENGLSVSSIATALTENEGMNRAAGMFTGCE